MRRYATVTHVAQTLCSSRSSAREVGTARQGESSHSPRQIRLGGLARHLRPLPAAAKALDELAANMTRAEIVEAQRMAQEWIPKVNPQPPP